MKIQFCGAAREVTGSCHLLTLDDGFTILLDCGLYQGRSALMKDFNEKWLFNPAEINCMILSHAHIDHAGRIPKLVKDGFAQTIFSTHATRELANIMLLDSARIQESDAEFKHKKAAKTGQKLDIEALYTTDDVRAAVKLFASFNYNHWFSIRENVEVMFTDAGHILGSASVTLKITEGGKTTTIGFSGDIGRPNRPILSDPQPMPLCDVLLCESTYGDRLHESAPEETEHFLKVIENTCVEKRGKLIIPAFSVGRTQEVVYILNKLVEAKRLPSISVYVDSPLAVSATQVFINHPECFDSDLHEFMLNDPNPFGFQNLKFIHDTEASKQLNTSDEPCIIIASSGMANAGRVKHHIANNIENPSTTILIVGYASPDSPAGQLRNGAKTIRLFGEVKKVKCDVEIMDSFSAHADYKEIEQFLDNQKDSLKKLFFVHGDFDTQIVFKKYLNDNGFPRIEIPELGEIIELTEDRLKTTPQYFLSKTKDEKQIEQGE